MMEKTTKQMMAELKAKGFAVMNKSLQPLPDNLLEDLYEREIMKAKYIRREGSKGHYKYIYKEAKGRHAAGGEDESGSTGKKEAGSGEKKTWEGELEKIKANDKPYRKALQKKSIAEAKGMSTAELKESVGWDGGSITRKDLTKEYVATALDIFDEESNPEYKLEMVYGDKENVGKEDKEKSKDTDQDIFENITRQAEEFMEEKEEIWKPRELKGKKDADLIYDEFTNSDEGQKRWAEATDIDDDDDAIEYIYDKIYDKLSEKGFTEEQLDNQEFWDYIYEKVDAGRN